MSEFSKQFNLWHIVNDKKYKTATLYRKALCKKFRNWKSPEDYSELSQEVRALKIEIEKLKADKQLVVVPKFVAEFIKEAKADYKLFGAFNEISEGTFGDDLIGWVFGENNQEQFASAWVNGYTVEKEKLYLLKHIEISSRDTTINCYLTHTFTPPFIGHTNFSKGYDMSDVKECHFTQSEIDDMATGSYEQIEVAENDDNC